MIDILKNQNIHGDIVNLVFLRNIRLNDCQRSKEVIYNKTLKHTSPASALSLHPPKKPSQIHVIFLIKNFHFLFFNAYPPKMM